MLRRIIQLLLVVSFCLPGCGSGTDRPAVYPVSGVVKKNGTPVPNATVNFFPEKGRPASGKTNETGEFKLTTFNTGDGAVAGMHKVSVVADLAEDVVSNSPGELKKIEAADSKVPRKYASPDTSELVNTVEPKSDNRFEINVD